MLKNRERGISTILIGFLLDRPKKPLRKNPANKSKNMKSIIAAVSGVAIVGLLWVFFKPPFGKNIVHLNTNQRVVALTYDDGPSPLYTDPLLDVLAKHDVKATFFMVGNRVEQHPETVRRVIAEGHQIGNHSYSHPVLGLLPPSQVRREIERTDVVLRRIGVKGEIVFRAPVLTRFLPVAWVLAKQDRAHVSCDVWSWDWITQNPDRITKTVLKKVKPGSIIVLHDGKGVYGNAKRLGTVEATDRIITALKREGYTFVRVSDVRQ